MNFLRNIFRIPFHTYLQFFYYGITHIYRVAWNITYKHIFQPLEEVIHQYSKKEPMETNWLEMYKLNAVTCDTTLGIPSTLYSSEEYYHYPHTDDYEYFLETEYPHCVSLISEPAKYDRELDQLPDTLETLFVARNQDKYLFRSFPLQVPVSKEFTMKDTVLSEVEFILVEYTHPKMNGSISFELPQGYYLVGNELFSPAFVQRYLELQREYYVFDDQYIINILDSEVNEQQLTFDQYIKLEEKSYLVYNISETQSLQMKDPSEDDSNCSAENKIISLTSTTDHSYQLEFSDSSSHGSEPHSSTKESNSDESSDEDREQIKEWWRQYIQFFT